MLTPEQSKKLIDVCVQWPEQKPEDPINRLKWFSNNHVIVFNKLLHRQIDGIYLELGSWTGAGSTEHVAVNFPKMSLICIDTFEGSPENHSNPAQKQISDNLLHHFWGNRWENRDRVYPIKAKSVVGLQLVAKLGIKPDFIYIDAAHDEAAVFADLIAALTLFPEAIILGDDYTKPGSDHCEVYQAIDKAVKAGLFTFSEIKHVGRAWYLTRNLA